MATIPCPHASPLSESQDWYRPQSEPVRTRGVRGYEVKERLRHHHAKRSYVAKVLAERRRKIYEEAMALLLTEEQAVLPVATVAVGNAVGADQAAAEKTFEQRFLEQADKWERETAHLSSPLQRMENPSYQAIMGMSAESPEHKRAIIRLMLRDLKTKHRDWFLALSYLTQHNPVDPQDYGKTSKLVQAWVRWGEKERYL